MTDHFDLTGKLAVVTGGGRGLGLSMARAFAEHGADLVLASRKVGVCEAAAAAISESTGRRAVGMRCHVGEWDEVTGFVDEVYERVGRVDVLVNNAGMSPLYSSLSEVTEALWDKVIDVNLKGPFRMSALVGERMKAAGGGSIINVSTIASVTPSPIEVPYGAAKAGVNNLTVGLARTLGPEVRVNCIVPGAFRTDISDAWDMEAVEAGMRQIPSGRIGEPDEVVGAALYFASDASSYSTGSMIKVDGGASRVVGGG